MAPKGHTNNPHGRPSLGDARRVRIQAFVLPTTRDRLQQLADERESAIGAVIDDLVARKKQKRPAV